MANPGEPLMALRLTPSILRELADLAEAQGVLRLAAVSLEDPGFAPSKAALRRHLDDGRHGEMGFMAKTADVRMDPSRMLPGAASALVGLVPYRGGPGPVARYARTQDYHTVMHRRLEPVEQALRDALPGVQTLVCVDSKPVLERTVAALAGLGFVGKNGCLIAPGLGSYVLLGEILCTAELEGGELGERPGGPALHRLWDACGTCRLCLDACPTDAFIGPGELDPRRCISYLTIEHRGPIAEGLADRMGERVAGCDVCQEVCPYNAAPRREDRAPSQAWLPETEGDRPPTEPAALAVLGSGRYRAFVRDTALRRIPRRSLRRNALLALGNRSGPLRPDEHDAIERGLNDDDEQIRDAAARALRRRG